MTDAATPELALSEATMTGNGSAAASAHQTAGPYWHLVDFPEWADTTRHFADAIPEGAERITLTGTLRDGNGALVSDALIEIWHADPAGRYPDQPGSGAGDPTAFQGYGRCATDKAGRFRFVTLKPGPVPLGSHAGANRVQAPHVALLVFARGLLQHLATRLYFAGEALNDTDPVLAAVPAARRGTLIAQPAGDGTWTLDLRLQGEGETVWMAV